MTHPASDVQGPVIRMADVAVGSLHDPRSVVAEGVNWTVKAGDFWVIAGLQGSGKTDFLMMTAGLSAPASGRYEVFEQEMPIFDDARLSARLQLGLVFEGGQLLHHLTVGENVALPIRYHENLTATDARERVEAMLKALELEEWANSMPGGLPRKWQKRVGLARALMLKPRVLLADDPLGGLDLKDTQWWLELFDRLARGHPLLDDKPVTLVVTAADLRPWTDHANRFAVLRGRQLVVLGGREQLKLVAAELLSELLPAGGTAVDADPRI